MNKSKINPEAAEDATYVEVDLDAIKITQSLMKDVRAYTEGDSCGILLREKYIKGRLLETTSKSMKNGAYFEYITTGNLPKNKQIPQPEYMVSKIKANGGKTEGLKVEDMYDDYRKIHAKKDKVLKAVADMGFEIVHVGKTYTKGRFVANIDCVVKATRQIVISHPQDKQVVHIFKEGDLCVMDLKYSGLIEDKWSVHGWQWVPIQKRYHGTQAKQYHFVTNWPFMFLVIGAGDSEDIKPFFVIFDKGSLEDHVAEGNALLSQLITYYQDDALIPRPEYKKCKECPLFAECKFKHEFPHPIAVDLSSE